MAHLGACTVVALGALVATFLLRGQRAAFRHAILFLALLRFAVPTAWLSDAGRAIVRMGPAHPRLQRAAEDLGWLLDGPAVGHPQTHSDRPGGLSYLWGAGAAICFIVWGRRSLRRIPAVRQPSGLEEEIATDSGVRLRIVAADVVPGAYGWWQPAVILPDGLSAQLSHVELAAVIAHEAAHIRRHDNLVAAISHAIVCIFWFHPLTWWMERRMLAERETACDELVLSHGARAEDYVLAILKVCRMSFAGAQGYAGVTGSNLGNRMEFIMSVDLNRRSSRIARALLGMLFALIVMLPVAGGYLHAQQAPPSNKSPIQYQALPTPDQKPSPADPRFQDGVTLLQEKKYAEAEQAFREAQQLDPESPRPLMGQVEVKTQQGQYDDALRLLQAEIDRNPSRTDWIMQFGNVSVRAGRYDVAIKAFQEVLSRLSADSKARGDLYMRIGETYRRKGELEPAIQNMRLAAEILADNPVALSTLGLVLEAAGRNEEAESEYRATLALDPKQAVALNNLAFLIAEKGGDLDRALEFAQQARELLPQLNEVSDTLGWVYLKKNLPETAIPIFDELVRKDPMNANYHYHLGLALEAKGDKFAAVEQYKSALACSPSKELAEKLRELMQ